MMTVFTTRIARLLFFPGTVVSVAFLVKGYSEVGDGFSAGVIAALVLLLQYLVFGFESLEKDLFSFQQTRFIPVLGLLISFFVAFLPILRGQPLLTHFPEPGAELIHIGALELHTTLLFDIGVFLIIFGFSLTGIQVIARTTRE